MFTLYSLFLSEKRKHFDKIKYQNVGPTIGPTFLHVYNSVFYAGATFHSI